MASASPFLTALLSGLATQAPTLLVCIAALAMTPDKLRHANVAARWAYWGFGLALALGILLPLAQAALQTWLVGGGLAGQRIAFVFAGFGMLAGLLHAVVLGLLFAAIVSERTAPTRDAGAKR